MTDVNRRKGIPMPFFMETEKAVDIIIKGLEVMYVCVHDVYVCVCDACMCVFVLMCARSPLFQANTAVITFPTQLYVAVRMVHVIPDVMVHNTHHTKHAHIVHHTRNTHHIYFTHAHMHTCILTY